VPVSNPLTWGGGDADGGPVTGDAHLEAGSDLPQALICSGISATNCASPEGLSPETVYCWQVVARDDSSAVQSRPAVENDYQQ